jgi:hypothetical protein
MLLSLLGSRTIFARSGRLICRRHRVADRHIDQQVLNAQPRESPNVKPRFARRRAKCPNVRLTANMGTRFYYHVAEAIRDIVMPFDPKRTVRTRGCMIAMRI